MADRTSVTKNLLDKLNNASDWERFKLLQGYLAEQVAQVLLLPTSRLDVDSPINYMGLDSLIAVELRKRIRNELGIELSITIFLEDVSVTILAAQLMELTEQMPTSGNSTGDTHAPSACESKSSTDEE